MVCEQNDPTAVGWQAVSTPTPPITTCAPGTGITVNYATGDAGYDDVRPTATISYRVIFTSTYSTVSDDAGRVVSDYFDVVYTDPCYKKSITLTAGVLDVTYKIHGAAATMNVASPVFSAVGTCAVTETIYAKLATADEDAW